MVTLIILNEEMNDIIKIIKSLEESGLLIKDISETIRNEAKDQKGVLFGMLFGALGVSLLGNLLTGKRVKLPKFSNIHGRGEQVRAGKGTIIASKRIVRTGQNF